MRAWWSNRAAAYRQWRLARRLPQAPARQNGATHRGPSPDQGAGRAVKAIGWATLGNSGAQIISLGFFLLLTHLLDPAEIGLFALAMVVQAFLGAFVSGPMGEVVIQHVSPKRSDLDAAFWLDTGLAVVLAGTTAMAAGLLADVMGHDELAMLIRLLCVAVVIGTLGNIPLALLQRRLEFRQVTRLSLIAQIVGGVAAVTLAFAGWGIWSLAANQLGETATKTILVWAAARWRPRLRIRPRCVRRLAAYWLNTIGFRLVYFACDNANRLIIGLILGPLALGYYTTAMRIVRMVVDTFCEGVSRAVLAIMSQIQSDAARLENGFHQLLRLTTLVTFPILGGLAVLGPHLMPEIFGQRWAPAGGILPVLCFYGAGSIALNLHGIAMRVVGRPEMNLLVFGAATTLDTLVLILLVPMGLPLALTVLAARGILFMPVLSIVTARVLGIRVGAGTRQYLPGVLATTALIPLLALTWEVLNGTMDVFAQTAIVLALAAVGHIAALLLFERQTLRTAIGVLRASALEGDNHA
ncbi:lipopolysaccharide biosynthesis protein [Consotaella aegiceratis]|uniref:lipopolysaccharide biosynthesis protein n=1 Tax=Consotaella aegiceratis TaxID=3097961 RepID=UPI002F3FB1A6